MIFSPRVQTQNLTMCTSFGSIYHFVYRQNKIKNNIMSKWKREKTPHETNDTNKSWYCIVLAINYLIYLKTNEQISEMNLIMLIQI
jgi:hypothetical protein